jgi:hypothetical protein
VPGLLAQFLTEAESGPGVPSAAALAEGGARG